MQDRQVNIQSLLPRLVSLVLRRGAPPPTSPHTQPTGHQPPQTQRPAGSGRASVGQLGVSPLAVLLLRLPHRTSIPRCLLGAIHFHGSRLQRWQRRSLSGGLLCPRPRESPPHLLQPDPGGGPSQPQVLPRRHLLPPPEPLLLLLQEPPRHRKLPKGGHLQHPVTTLPQALPGLPLRVPGVAPDVHLFKVEMAGEGEAWGHVGPH